MRIAQEAIPAVMENYLASQTYPDTHGYLEPICKGLLENLHALLTIKSMRGATDIAHNVEDFLEEGRDAALTKRLHHSMAKNFRITGTIIAIYNHALSLRKTNKD